MKDTTVRRKRKAKAGESGIPEKTRLTVEVVIAEKKFGREISKLKGFCLETCSAALELTPPAKYFAVVEMNVMLANDKTVKNLNKKFRGKNLPTNVLSFPAQGLNLRNYRKFTSDFVMLGDIAVAYETVKQEAKAQGKKFIDHLRHLLIHAVLHLVGYDHGKTMETLEIKLLKRYGIKNPYII